MDREGRLWAACWGLWGGGVIAVSTDGGVTWTRRDTGLEDFSVRAIAVDAMRARGLDPDFPADAMAEAATLRSAPETADEPVQDLRSRLWCSIDNDDSRDLDQLSVAEALPGGSVKVLIAIADVNGDGMLRRWARRRLAARGAFGQPEVRSA